MHYIKYMTVCLIALSFIAQTVNAVSTPCPMLSESDKVTISAEIMQDDSASPCHESNTDNLKDKQNSDSQSCCGEASCPMNFSMTGILFNHLNLTPSLATASLYISPRPSNYRSAPFNLLYRPPITA